MSIAICQLQICSDQILRDFFFFKLVPSPVRRMLIELYIVFKSIELGVNDYNCLQKINKNDKKNFKKLTFFQFLH